MTTNAQLSCFIDAARRVGTEITQVDSLQDAAACIALKAGGTTLVPETLLNP